MAASTCKLIGQNCAPADIVVKVTGKASFAEACKADARPWTGQLVHNQHYGVPLARRFHYNRPPTILDTTIDMEFAALDIPDPKTRFKARVVGEEVSRRSPVTRDRALTMLEDGGDRTHEALTARI